MYIKLKGITPKELQQLMEIKFWRERFCDATTHKETIGNTDYVFSEDAVFEIFDDDCFDIRYTRSRGFVFLIGLLEAGYTKSATIVFGEDVD